MDRNIPSNFLFLLEKWFSVSISCVKWGSSYSEFFSYYVVYVRVEYFHLSYLLSLLIVLLIRFKTTGLGCYLNSVCVCVCVCVSILLYADDIVLSAPSVAALQCLLEVCERELDNIDMLITAKKSYCIRIGPRFKIDCRPLVTKDNRELKWCGSIRYRCIHYISDCISVFSQSYQTGNLQSIQCDIWQSWSGSFSWSDDTVI